MSDDLRMRLAREWAPSVYASLMGPDEDEIEDAQGLSIRQSQQRIDLLALAEQYGPFDPTIGADGAHYATENPFASSGITCANCVFFEDEESRCEIVSGKIEAEAICKLWVIPQSKLSMQAVMEAPPEEAVAQFTHAGLLVQAMDTGRVLLLQRALTPEDPAGGSWEAPGGSIDPGEDPLEAAMREFQEETGMRVPPGEVVATWTSGTYKGHVLRVADEGTLPINADHEDRHTLNPDDPDGDMIEVMAWWDPRHMKGNPAVRRELQATIDEVLTLLGVEEEVDPQDDAEEAKKKPHFWVKEDDPEDAKKKSKCQEEARAFVTVIDGRTFVTAKAAVTPDLNLWDRPPTDHPMMTWVQARLVGGDEPNRNGAMWSGGDLQMALPTVSHGPLNWLHESKHIVGSIVDAKFMPGNPASGVPGEVRPYIASLAGIWDWEWPDEAAVVQMASETGRLAISMECIADQIACIGAAGCGKTFDYSEYSRTGGCEHLAQRVSQRQLIKPMFLGAGVIVPPARPGWAHADMQVMNRAKAQAEKAAESVGGTWGLSDEEWEQQMLQVLQYATVK